MSAFARVAHIAKTRNLEGSVVANSVDGLPFLLCEGMEVHFVPPTLRGPRSAVVASIKQLREDSYEVIFEGIDSIDDAELIAGCYCLALKDSLPDLDELETPQLLVGFTVQDESMGLLGQVVDVLSSSAQSVLVVQGDEGEVLIPIVDEFISGLDEEESIIFVSIPAGLVSIN